MKNNFHKFIHFKTRAWQRYKINLSTEDCLKIQQKIGEENRINKVKEGKYLHLIVYAGRGMYCICSKDKKLITILKKEMTESN